MTPLLRRSAIAKARGRFATRVAAVSLGSALCVLLAASAQADEFTGRIAALSASKLTVDRAGDKVSFQKLDSTVVSGAKTSWSALAKGDRVSVSWKFEDKPPKAYRVRVLPGKGGR